MADTPYGGSVINSDVDAVAPPSAYAASVVEDVECQRCHQSFADAEALRRHKRKKGHYSCDQCSQSFYNPETLQNHHKLLHQVAPELSCPCCKLTFPTGGEFFQHIENNSCPGISAASIARRREKMLQFSRDLSKHSVDPLEQAMLGNYTPIDPKNAWQDYDADNEMNTFAGAPSGEAIGGRQVIYQDNVHKVYYQPEDFPAVQTRETKPNGWNAGSTGAKRPPAPGRVSYNAVPPPASFDPPSARNPPRQLENTDPNRKIRFMKVEELPIKPGTTPSETGTRVINPSHPDFNPSVFWNPNLEKFVCPHDGCKTKVEIASALTQHLKTARHGRGSIQCPGCRKTFFMVHQMISHVEKTQSCSAREYASFRSALGQATGGLIDVDSTPPGPAHLSIDQRVLKDLLQNWQ
ncbi:hypothetical protein GGR57DRAFT_514477 [Xylariaceae sp. FL1272]|nr:hypothetical protein GGR57DRAFT_514477 [Xylariaceae sp. FL1272]